MDFSIPLLNNISAAALRSFEFTRSVGVQGFYSIPPYLWRHHYFKSMELPYAVYILKCANGKHYTGFSANIFKRLRAHNRGEVHFTKDKLPVTLVHLSLFVNKQKAYDFERYLKSGSGVSFRNKRLL